MANGLRKTAGMPQSFNDLLRMLEEGWTIGQPVYVQHSLLRRNQLVYRLVLWRDGKPTVVTIPDGHDIRQFVADQHLRRESL